MLLSTLNDPISVVIAVVVSLIFVLLACLFVALWISDLRKARATRSWPTTTGRILHARVSRYEGYVRGGGGYHTYYDPAVTYEYTVDGTTYQGKRIAIGTGYSTQARNAVKRRISAYHAGKEVQVFYDPADPKQAVLEHGIEGGVMLLILAGITLVVVAALMLPWNRVLSAILHK